MFFFCKNLANCEIICYRRLLYWLSPVSVLESWMTPRTSSHMSLWPPPLSRTWIRCLSWFESLGWAESGEWETYEQEGGGAEEAVGAVHSENNFVIESKNV